MLLVGLPASAGALGRQTLAAGFLIGALAAIALVVSFFIWTDGPRYVTSESSLSQGSRGISYSRRQERAIFQPGIGSIVALRGGVSILFGSLSLFRRRAAPTGFSAIKAVVFD